MDIDELLHGWSETYWGRSSGDALLDIAIIGLGDFARRRALPAIAEASNCRSTVVVSGSPDKANAACEQFGISRSMTYDEFHDGVASDEFDAVYVATPNAHHLEFIETAANHDKDVICEKPLEVTVDRAKQAVEVCETSDVTLMMAYRLQTDPAIRKVRALVREGVVGDPLHLTGQFSMHLFQGSRSKRNWRLNPTVSGGGTLIDVGIYPLNLGRFLVEADPVAVSARTYSTDQAFSDVEEHASFEVEFPDSTTGSYFVSSNAQETDRFQVIGTDGSITVDAAHFSESRREVTVGRGLDDPIEVEVPGKNEIRTEFEYFAHCVRSGSAIEPDGCDGLTDVRIIQAAYRSSENDVRVDL